MDFGPGTENKTKRRVQDNSRTTGVDGLLLAPSRQFFATSPVACPYIPGRAERKLIVELGGSGGAAFYDDLSRAGFRRSHRFAYRPGVPRLRLLRAGADRRRALLPHSLDPAQYVTPTATFAAVSFRPRATPEQFRLFSAYQRLRHGDSDMASMRYGDYRGMVEDTPVRTAIAEFRDGCGSLVAASLIDLLDDGVSAVYSFYDPHQPKRSLGIWSVLWLVEECQRRGLPFVYLGYWIADSPKMAYKHRFPALERLDEGGWTAFAR